MKQVGHNGKIWLKTEKNYKLQTNLRKSEIIPKTITCKPQGILTQGRLEKLNWQDNWIICRKDHI